MSKKRVHELAKELGLENKDLIAHLERLGITVKSTPAPWKIMKSKGSGKTCRPPRPARSWKKESNPP